MKRAISIIAAAILLGPLGVSAATVQVYPFITSAHGGTKSAVDMTSCIEHDGTKECAQSVPTFSLPDGSGYSVKIYPAAGYSYTLDSNCSGVAQDDIVCNVDYRDGAPIVLPEPILPPDPAANPSPAEGAITPAPDNAAEIKHLEEEIQILLQLVKTLQELILQVAKSR